jgi:pimeloyl-ACP methyl ester carboxylesterase
MAQAPARFDTDIEGARIHLRCWGAEGAPGIVLVHGGAAHSGWWDHIAPFFAAQHRVVALDLSGHGDSGRRPGGYSLPLWAAEVLGAASAGGIAGPPLVVGHSMGGWVATTVGATSGDDVDGIVIIDSPLNDQPPEEERLRKRRRPLRVYPERAEILGRFTTTPPQDVLLPYVRDHIAEESIRAVGDDGSGSGWTWKFDPMMFAERLPLRELLPQVRCRAAFIRSEFGLVPPSMAGEIDELLGHRVPMVELPDAGHHPMLDQPLPLVTALRMLVQQWALSPVRG